VPGQAGPSAPQRQIATERAMLEGALVRDEATAPDFAGKTLRLAEWYASAKGSGQ